MKLDISFSCYLMSVLSLNIFVLNKMLIFELCHYFILFLSFLILGRNLSKNRHTPTSCGL